MHIFPCFHDSSLTYTISQHRACQSLVEIILLIILIPFSCYSPCRYFKIQYFQLCYILRMSSKSIYINFKLEFIFCAISRNITFEVKKKINKITIALGYITFIMSDKNIKGILVFYVLRGLACRLFDNIFHVMCVFSSQITFFHFFNFLQIC